MERGNGHNYTHRENAVKMKTEIGVTAGKPPATN